MLIPHTATISRWDEEVETHMGGKHVIQGPKEIETADGRIVIAEDDRMTARRS